MTKSEFHEAQIEVIEGLHRLAGAGGHREKEAIQRALSILHLEIFAMSFEDVYIVSHNLLMALNEELGFTEEVL